MVVVVVVVVVVAVVVVVVVVVVVANVQLRPSPVADTYDEFRHAHLTADAWCQLPVHMVLLPHISRHTLTIHKKQYSTSDMPKTQPSANPIRHTRALLVAAAL